MSFPAANIHYLTQKEPLTLSEPHQLYMVSSVGGSPYLQHPGTASQHSGQGCKTKYDAAAPKAGRQINQNLTWILSGHLHHLIWRAVCPPEIAWYMYEDVWMEIRRGLAA